MIRIISIHAIEPRDIEEAINNHRIHEDGLSCYSCGSKNPCCIIYTHTAQNMFNDWDIYCQDCIAEVIARQLKNKIYQDIFRNTMKGKNTSREISDAEQKEIDIRKNNFHNCLANLTYDLDRGKPGATKKALDVIDKLCDIAFKSDDDRDKEVDPFEFSDN